MSDEYREDTVPTPADDGPIMPPSRDGRQPAPQSRSRGERPPGETRAGRAARAQKDGVGQRTRPQGAGQHRALRPDGPVVPPTKKRRRGRGCLVALLVLVVTVGALGGGTWWMLFKPQVDAPPGQPVQLEIPKGSGTAQIADQLAAAAVVENALMFRIQARMEKRDGTLRPGVYDLATGMPYTVVLDILEAGPVIEYYTLSIPEGWTIEQIAKRVEAKTGIPAAEFAALANTGAAEFDYPFLADDTTGSLQGYLFPKTYRIVVGSDAHAIIDVMLTQFSKETAALDLTFARSRGMNMHQIVTIASIIEREARVQKDRPLISSVIYNRLQKGMMLEICATVQFVVGNKPRLLYSDLRVESPYNTYLHKGLPPGPIASPGMASLQAAVAPADTTYLYYVLTHKDGSHSFSKTLKEHLRYKAQAEKGLR